MRNFVNRYGLALGIGALLWAGMFGSAAISQQSPAVNCVVTTAAPSYTNGTIRSCSLDTSGGMRISGTITITPSGTQTVVGATTAADGAALTATLKTYSIGGLYNTSTIDLWRAAADSLNSVGTGLATSQLVSQCDDTSPTAITENSFGNVRFDCATHSLLVAPNRSGVIDRSISLTTGGTSQQSAPARASRKYLMCQNIDTTNVEDVWLNIGTTAAANTAGSIRLVSGAAVTFDGTWVPTDAIQVVAATTGHKITCKEA